MHDIYLSLGSNIGDRMANLALALDHLRTGIVVDRVSSYYETDPVDYTDQDPFINLAVRGRTDLAPEELLSFTQSIEMGMKRIKTIRYGPRVIDIDILLYDDIAYKSERLEIPHPKMLQRAFVLVPLLEIEPMLKIRGNLISKLPAAMETQGVRRLPGKEGEA